MPLLICLGRRRAHSRRGNERFLIGLTLLQRLIIVMLRVTLRNLHLRRFR